MDYLFFWIYSLIEEILTIFNLGTAVLKIKTWINDLSFNIILNLFLGNLEFNDLRIFVTNKKHCRFPQIHFINSKLNFQIYS